MDGDKEFGHYKDALKENDDLAGEVKRSARERETLDVTMAEFARVIANLQAQLRDSELTTSNLQAKLKKSELEVAREKEANKELNDELIMFKKEPVQQHEKGFFKGFRYEGLFSKGLDLNLFDLFKDVKDGKLLDEDEITTIEESNGGEEDDRVDV